MQSWPEALEKQSLVLLLLRFYRFASNPQGLDVVLSPLLVATSAFSKEPFWVPPIGWVAQGSTLTEAWTFVTRLDFVAALPLNFIGWLERSPMSFLMERVVALLAFYATAVHVLGHVAEHRLDKLVTRACGSLLDQVPAQSLRT